VKLADAITLYLQLVRAQGCVGTNVAAVLRMFARTMGSERELNSIPPEEVRIFLDGNRPLTRYWHRKHSGLLGFFRFAFARGMVTRIPLPGRTPRCHQTFQPYVYTDNDMVRLIDAIGSLHASCIEPRTIRTFLLLLFGTGLRLSEALNLCLADVDLQQNLLTIRETKFYKTRWVPIGPDLAGILRDYVQAHPAPRNAEPTAPLLVRRDGSPLTASGIRRAFVRLRSIAGVQRHDGVSNQPRLHDLRATFAVRRLTAWYRQGADVQRLLPLLSTYLGHASVAATQVYLPMTPDLLAEASARFELYARAEEDLL
jgi:integrase/recombinase XerD